MEAKEVSVRLLPLKEEAAVSAPSMEDQVSANPLKSKKLLKNFVYNEMTKKKEWFETNEHFLDHPYIGITYLSTK